MLNTATIYECLVDSKRTREIRDLIRLGRGQYGSQTFDQHIYDLVQAGKVKQEDGLRSANNPDELMLRFAGVSDDE